MSFRFGVHDDTGRRSTVWSIFTIGGSNVALASSDAAGRMKISLHQSGRWQVGYTSEYEKRERQAGRWNLASRHWERWQRPIDVQVGYTSALKIIVPPTAMSARPAPKASRPTRLMVARPDKAVMFSVCIAKTSIPPWPYGTDQENTLLGTLSLPNGEHVLVGGHYVDGARATKDMLLALGRFARFLLRSDTTKLKPPPDDATLYGFSEDRDGTKVIMEIALWSIHAVHEDETAPSGLIEPIVSESIGDAANGFIDLPLRMPRSVLAERGVENNSNSDRARAIICDWNEHKLAELRRLFRLV